MALLPRPDTLGRLPSGGRRQLTTCAWPSALNSTVSRRGPTRPPLLALMNTMSGVSATSGPMNVFVPTRYSAGILQQPAGGRSPQVLFKQLVNR